MSAKLTYINPRRERMKVKSKRMIRQCCDTIDGLNGEVAGFVVLAWDESGNTYGYCESGGIISADALPAHVFAAVNRT